MTSKRSKTDDIAYETTLASAASLELTAARTALAAASGVAATTAARKRLTRAEESKRQADLAVVLATARTS